MKMRTETTRSHNTLLFLYLHCHIVTAFSFIIFRLCFYVGNLYNIEQYLRG